MKEPGKRRSPKKKIQPAYLNSWIIIGAAAAAAITAVIFSINGYYREYLNTSEYIAQIPIPQKEAALIEFDFGEDRRRLFRGEIAKETYPLDAALRSAGENGNFTFQVKDGALMEIAGKRGKWSIYLNGEKISTAWDELDITGGDKYTFRYEK